MNQIFLHWDNEKTAQMLAQALSQNKLVLGTTDTVLGLFAATTESGFKALNVAKKRSNKPYLVLVGSSDRINYYADQDKSLHIENIVKRFWPGPLTIILKAKPEVPRYMVSGEETIALRMPKHAGIQSLLTHSGDLFSTSANLAQEPVPESFKAVNPDVLEHVEYCVEGGDTDTVPSTLIDCSDPTNIKVIREGAISVKDLAV